MYKFLENLERMFPIKTIVVYLLRTLILNRVGFNSVREIFESKLSEFDIF